MKLLDAIYNVDRSEKNTSYEPSDGVFKPFGIYDTYDELDYDRIMADKSFSSHYLIRWNCTDTWVGLRVFYIRNQPVAYSTQSARKNSEDFVFIDDVGVEMIKDFIAEYRKFPEHSDLTFLDPKEEIDDTYSISSFSSLIDDAGLYEGRPVTVDRAASVKLIREPGVCYYTYPYIVVIDGGEQKTILCKDLVIPTKVKNETV